MDNHFKNITYWLKKAERERTTAGKRLALTKARNYVDYELKKDHFNEKQLTELLSKISSKDDPDIARDIARGLLEKHTGLWNQDRSDIILLSVLRHPNLLNRLDAEELDKFSIMHGDSLAVALYKKDLGLITQVLEDPEYDALNKYQTTFFAKEIGQLLNAEINKEAPNYKEVSSLLKTLKTQTRILSAFPEGEHPLDAALAKAREKLTAGRPIDPDLKNTIQLLSSHTKGSFQEFPRVLSVLRSSYELLSKIPAPLAQPLLKSMDRFVPVLTEQAILKDIKKEMKDAARVEKVLSFLETAQNKTPVLVPFMLKMLPQRMVPALVEANSRKATLETAKTAQKSTQQKTQKPLENHEHNKIFKEGIASLSKEYKENKTENTNTSITEWEAQVPLYEKEKQTEKAKQQPENSQHNKNLEEVARLKKSLTQLKIALNLRKLQKPVADKNPSSAESKVEEILATLNTKLAETKASLTAGQQAEKELKQKEGITTIVNEEGKRVLDKKPSRKLLFLGKKIKLLKDQVGFLENKIQTLEKLKNTVEAQKMPVQSKAERNSYPLFNRFQKAQQQKSGAAASNTTNSNPPANGVTPKP
eukprot:TRINITY_DN11345_c0_g1_i1.p1 TRINITY_DN11345_c0_g1~~TRINITY_DN11345_c0_g1_i1.p1  ORF type:complete len:590 (+),score=-70.29 TRINITY_DN11345_c0_g1_i1:18-1787(+)